MSRHLVQDLFEPYLDPVSSIDDLARRWEALPYQSCGERFVLGEIAETTRVLLIGEALGEEEERQFKPFIGAAGQKLRNTLHKIGMPEGVSIINIVPRRPFDAKGRNRTPEDAEIKANLPYVKNLIRILRPELVVLLGNSPLFAFTGRKKIYDERGVEFKHSEFDVTFLPTLHPANTLYRPSAFPLFESDLKWAVRLLQGNTINADDLPPFPFYTTSIDLNSLISTEEVYFDLEAGATPPATNTSHWDPRVNVILASFGWIQGEPQAIVVEWNDTTSSTIKAFLESPRKWVGQNVLQFDQPLLQAKGININVHADTYIIARLLDETASGGLKERLRNTLGITGRPYRTKTEATHFHERWHLWQQMDREEKRRRIHYSALDAWGGIQDWQNLKQEFARHPKLQRLYRDVLAPACAAAVEMERTGLPVDVNALWRLALETHREVRRATQRILDNLPEDAWKTVNPPKSRKPIQGSNALINPGSTQQLGRILFNIFGFPPMRLTDAGLESTNEDSLLRLLDLEGYPEYRPEAFTILRAALDMREQGKTLNGFLIPFMERIKASPDQEWRRTRVGRLRGRFHVAGTDTLRLASSSPNLQNISRSIRHIFKAPPGYLLINSDYSGLEVRGAADLSQDPTLLRLLRQGQDLHSYNTQQFLGLSDEAAIDKNLRYATKTLFFSSIYGSRENKIDEVIRKKFRDARIGVEVVREILTRKEIEPGRNPYRQLAEVWLEWLFKKYPSLRTWHNRVRRQVSRTGTIETWFGHTRHFTDALSDDRRAQEDAVRAAINAVPQSLSLLTLTAMRDLMQIRGGTDDWQFIAQVHDSISLLVREDVADMWVAIVKDVMENDLIWREFETSFSVPLVAEVSLKKTWS